METTTLFSPQLAAALGPYTFIQGVALAVYSSKTSYFDWAKVRFTGEYQEQVSLARKDPAAVRIGYGGALEEVFTGFVARPYNQGGGADEVLLKDEMLLLEETEVQGTFLDTTPQEMLAYLLAQAGVSRMRLSGRDYPTRKRVPIRRMSALQAIQAVHAAWGVHPPFFFSGGVFYWDEKPAQDQVYVFEYGVNILALRRSGGVWELETVSAPFVRHSHKIQVIHPKFTGEAEAIKVVSLTNDDGFLRTKIYF